MLPFLLIMSYTYSHLTAHLAEFHSAVSLKSSYIVEDHGAAVILRVRRQRQTEREAEKATRRNRIK